MIDSYVVKENDYMYHTKSLLERIKLKLFMENVLRTIKNYMTHISVNDHYNTSDRRDL